MDNNVEKRWISVNGFEEEFEVSASTQNKMRMSGKLPYSKLGKKVFYDRIKIDKMFEDAKV